MVSIGICSDNAIDRAELRGLCKKMRNHLKQEEFEIVEFSSIKGVMTYEAAINILLLNMKENDLAQLLWKDEIEIRENIDMIVFISDYIEAVFYTFGRKTRGFLLKPIKENQFMEIMKQCLLELKEIYEVWLKPEEAFENNQVFFIESMKNYTYIHFQNRKLCIRKTLKEWERELQQYHFIRVQKSYLVNMKQIERIKDEIKLKNGKQIPIGRTYKKKVKSLYAKFLEQQGNNENNGSPYIKKYIIQ